MFLLKQFPDVPAVVREVMEKHADHDPWDAVPPSTHLQKAFAHLARMGRDLDEPHAAHALVRVLMWFQTGLSLGEFESAGTPEVREHIKKLRPLLLSMGFSDELIAKLPDKIFPGERISFVQYGRVQVRAIDGSVRAIHRSELE